MLKEEEEKKTQQDKNNGSVRDLTLHSGAIKQIQKHAMTVSLQRDRDSVFQAEVL